MIFVTKNRSLAILAVVSLLNLSALAANEPAEESAEIEWEKLPSMSPELDKRLREVEVQRDAEICKGMKIPQGYIIVSQAFLPACPGTGVDNAWRIREPYYYDTACFGPPIPAGWVKVRSTWTQNCPGGLPANANEIRHR